MCEDTCVIKSRGHAILYMAAAIALILLSTGGAGGNRAQAQVRQPTIEERQRSLRTLSREKPAEEQPLQSAAYELIEEDFALLQTLNNNLSEAVGSNNAINYKQIKRDAAEMKKCAARLKTNLSLPEAEKGEKPKKNEEAFLIPEDLTASITMLDAVVRSFFSNHLFWEPGVLDVKYSTVARRDLERIGSLSEHIRRRAESLGKAATRKP